MIVNPNQVWMDTENNAYVFVTAITADGKYAGYVPCRADGSGQQRTQGRQAHVSKFSRGARFTPVKRLEAVPA